MIFIHHRHDRAFQSTCPVRGATSYLLLIL
nr:MAG TPA: hypothetical protein [Caudoviricetes sp.]